MPHAESSGGSAKEMSSGSISDGHEEGGAGEPGGSSSAGGKGQNFPERDSDEEDPGK
jgi:hypothetical protein